MTKFHIIVYFSHCVQNILLDVLFFKQKKRQELTNWNNTLTKNQQKVTLTFKAEAGQETKQANDIFTGRLFSFLCSFTLVLF